MDLELLPARHGHFLMESGHHGNLWLERDLGARRVPDVRPRRAPRYLFALKSLGALSPPEHEDQGMMMDVAVEA